MVVESGIYAIAFVIARVLFGGVLAFQGLNHFLNLDDMSGYAEMQGVPAPTLGVVVSGLALIGGGLGIVLGAFPLLAAAALIVFFVVVTPTMHPFWSVDDPEQSQTEMINFLKNLELLGASLVFLVLANESWPYALGLGL